MTIRDGMVQRCMGLKTLQFRQIADASPTIFSNSKTARVGEAIFFPKGQVPYEARKGNEREFPNHGIVIDTGNWTGRPTSSLGMVSLTNPWWIS